MNNIIRKMLFIPKCVVCAKPADKGNLCDDCAQLLRKERIKPSNMPDKKIEFVDKVYASYYYDGAARTALLRAKFNNPASFLAYIADDVSVDIRRILEENKVDMIVPAPFHKSKLYKSEFDLPCEMAKRISKFFGIDYQSPVTKVKATAKQHDLPLEERKANLIGAFRVDGQVSGKNILLIDDVITTGNTLSNIALRLKAAGRDKVWRWSYTFNELKPKGEYEYGNQ